MDLALSIDNLKVAYRGNSRPAVDGLSLHIPKGCFYGLLGPNGAGKTTTMSVLNGLMRHQSGNIHMLGTRLPDTSSQFLRQLGWVPQDIAVYDSLTARENLRFFGAMQGIGASELDERIGTMLEEFGLSPHATRPVGQFSGGMKRRVNIIAGIIHRPALLLLDEPTVGIDVQSRSLIHDCLRRLNGNGTTIIYTGHHLDEAERMCHMVGIMDHGRLIAEGSPQALLTEHADCTDLEQVFLKLTGRSLRD